MTVTITGHPLQAAQPIIEDDGTMAYHFRDWAFRVNDAVGDSSLVSVWGNISGTLSAQTDLQSALDAKASSTHTHPTSDIVSGTFADARIAESNVTQHEAALLITGDQVTEAFEDDASTPYTLVLGDANKCKRFTAANAAITWPAGTFAAGDVISIRQAGTGTLTLDITAITLNGSAPTWGQHVEHKFRYLGSSVVDLVY